MYKKLFFWGNVALFILLILAIAKDTFRPWMPYQRKYREMQMAAETAPPPPEPEPILPEPSREELVLAPEGHDSSEQKPEHDRDRRESEQSLHKASSC